ncbi:MAG: CDP-diacylglycerol--glycerol-3-phosphate 3-phosphatidyltransferase [Clostridiaceae bacterium]|jgi:CDP-diacylglycerol--glycerol-3-phosphate 3-phosphatidyltransferase|nr:CDP-diacylglycerol--glycerol-3-phosphate 3-phosphatidyltransferase [Clostridiaceae bacterium]
MNLPNKLTLLRIFTIPVFLLLLLPIGENKLLLPIPMQTGRILAALVFILAALTDLLDGAIARKRHCVTTFGKFLDPIADKLLVSSALMALVELGEVSAWAVVIIIAREFLVQGIRIIAANDAVVISASILGKIKTVSQMIAIILILLWDFPFSLFSSFPVGQVFLWISVALTVYSGYDYLQSNWDRLKN